ncbi:DUF4112 domain-containing protein [Roseovarius arcticus]|uniref:DUF4112 domain-containing protein n=1 Tax=Roseovarius arcticus TaxID=2547404 RepID=UPI001FEACFBB|nr:DUF4112 domain-containing protein [Roseovarius arcticus]
MRRPDELAGDTSPDGPQRRSGTKISQDLDRIDRMAQLMDAQFRLPVVGTRIGLDGIVGLVPGIGDLLMFGPAVWMITKGWQHGARKRTILRMMANSGTDFVLGAVPLVGDLFDIGFKANIRNARLLRRDLGTRDRS